MEEQNNLDRCFNSIFENHLRFQIEDSEVDFIQTAVETLVSKLIDEIEAYGNKKKTEIISEFFKQNSGFKRICDGTENNEKFLKTGSFYEATKNGYPDEFDYVYVICTLEVEETFEDFTWLKYYFTLNEFHDTVQNIMTKKIKRKKYKYSQNGRCIYFYRYYRIQGPSSKLTFRYKIKGVQTNEERDIDADIVPAFKVIDKRLHERIWDVCFVKGFAKRIVATRSYLITNEVSFTETEGLFMMNELSPVCKKAYRLLKYILNGNGNGERLRKNIPKVGISTYMIKVATINHYFSRNCKFERYVKPSDCVIMILKDILRFCIAYKFNTEPCLKKFHGSKFEMQPDYVEQTVYSIHEILRQLRSLQENKSMYDDIKSVSECIFDYTQMQSSTGHLSFNNSKSYSGNTYSSSVSSRRLSFSLADITNTSWCSGRRNSSSRQFEMYDSDYSTGPVSLHSFEIIEKSSDLPFDFSFESLSNCQKNSLKNAKDQTQCKERQSDKNTHDQCKANLREKRRQRLNQRVLRKHARSYKDVRNLFTENKRDNEDSVLSNQIHSAIGLKTHISDKDNIQHHGKEQSEPQSGIIINTHDDNFSSEGVECSKIYGKSPFYSIRTESTPYNDKGFHGICAKPKKKRKMLCCILI